MIERILRLLAILACGFLLASLGLFAVDQSGSASQQAQAEVNASGARALGPAVSVSAHHTALRSAIDDAAATLASPFEGFAPAARGSWGDRIFTTALGLLLYGFGLGAIARSIALARLKPPPAPTRTWTSF
ncbi:MAG: hypothetical protein ACR2ND_02940 [Solirubrobacteraceae bacterium]